MTTATPEVASISRWLTPRFINLLRKKRSRQPADTEQADIFAIVLFAGGLPFNDDVGAKQLFSWLPEEGDHKNSTAPKAMVLPPNIEVHPEVPAPKPHEAPGY